LTVCRISASTSARQTWRRRKPHNGRGQYLFRFPNGDNVGVLERWVFPDAFDGVTTVDTDWVRTLVREKEFRADSRACAWIGKPVAERLKINLADDAGKARVKRVLKTWIMNGVLATEVRHDRNRNKCEFVVPGNWNEASGTIHADAA